MNRNRLFSKYSKGSVLDVGSYESDYWKEILDAGATRVYGLDTRGETDFNVDLNDLFDIMNTLNDHSFDTIICGEIIEHLNNPYNVLLTLKEHLTKNGVIIITTPNARCLSYSWNRLKEHPQHIYCWDLTLLKRFMSKLGFKEIESGETTSVYSSLFKGKGFHIYYVGKVRK